MNINPSEERIQMYPNFIKIQNNLYEKSTEQIILNLEKC